MAESEEVIMVDCHCGSEDEDDDTQSDNGGDFSDMEEMIDDDFSDIDLAPGPSQLDSPQQSLIPKLDLADVKRGAQAPFGSQLSATSGVGVIENEREPLVVDILIHGFTFDSEIVARAKRERNISPQALVALAFGQALNIEPHQLEFHQVVNLSSHTSVPSNNRVAVALQSSVFSLNRMEELLKTVKQREEDCENYKRRLAESQESVRKLRNDLNDKEHKLREKESENRKLMQDHERMRRGFHSQLPIPANTMTPTTLSPRMLATGGPPPQTHLHTNLANLQRVVAENQQLVSDIAQVVTAPNIDYT